MLREVKPAWEVRILALLESKMGEVIEVVVGPYLNRIQALTVAKQNRGDDVLVTVEEVEVNPNEPEEA